MSKEDEFKQRFIAMMQNLHEAGVRDREAIWLMGSLAARLLDRSRQPNWPQFKQSRTKRGYDKLLADFEVEGNSYHTQKKLKQAYAIQVLAMSLIAGTQKDPDISAGNGLLNEIIDKAVGYYRKYPKGAQQPTKPAA